MSADRITVVEHRIAELERRLAQLEKAGRAPMPRRTAALPSAGVLALGLIAASVVQGGGTRAQDIQQPLTVRAPFRVVNAIGDNIFTIEQAGSETRLNIVDAGRVVASLSSGYGASSLNLGGEKGSAQMAVDFDGPGTGPSLILKGSKEVLKVAAGAATINAPLVVSPKDAPVLRVDPEMVTVSHSMSVRAAKGHHRTAIAATGLSVYGADGASTVAGLGINSTGNTRLIVGSSSGPRGVMGLLSSGEVSLALLHGKRNIGLSVGADTGNLHLSNGTGFTAVSLDVAADGRGEMTLGGVDGATLVEAGVTDSGLGYVKTGPSGRIPATPEGLPSAILGRKQE